MHASHNVFKKHTQHQTYVAYSTCK